MFSQGSDLEQFSEELRLSGQFGAHQLVGGIYFLSVSGDYTGQFADPFYGYFPEITAAQDTDSYAIFAQDEWKVTDKVSLIAGLRYWRDQREGAYYGTEPLAGMDIRFDSTQVFGQSFGVDFDENQDVVPITLTPEDADRTFDDITARLELDYRVNDDLLLFASYNRGSKSGGFSFSTGTPFADFEDPCVCFNVPLGTDAQFLNGIPFDPETLNAFEAGFKATIGGTTTFNASAFYYDYEDYQAFVTAWSQPDDHQSARHRLWPRGGNLLPPVDGLTLQLGVSALSSNVEDIVLPDTVTEVEHDMPQAPSFSGNAMARYEFVLGGGMASVQADVLYSDDFCFTVLCAPVEEESSYTVANARIAYGAEDGRWEVAIFGDNLPMRSIASMPSTARCSRASSQACTGSHSPMG